MHVAWFAMNSCVSVVLCRAVLLPAARTLATARCPQAQDVVTAPLPPLPMEPVLQKSWVLKGGHLAKPMAINVQEEEGAVFWSVSNGSKELTEFLSPVPFYKRPLSRTSVVDVLRGARDSVQTEILSAAAVPEDHREAACQTLVDEAHPLAVGTKRRKLSKATASALDGGILTIQVPCRPGSLETVALRVKGSARKTAEVALELTAESLKWLMNWSSEDGFKRTQLGPTGSVPVRSGCAGVTWNARRCSWSAAFRRGARWSHKDFVVQTTSDSSDFELEKERALQAAVRFRAGLLSPSSDSQNSENQPTPAPGVGF